MPRLTERYERESRRSHTAVSYVDVIGATQETLRLVAISGDVNVDRTASIRRSCSVTCIDPNGLWTPRGPESLLTPFGTEIRPYRGVRYADGTEEVHPLGVFRISKSDPVEDEGSIQIRIESYDRSRTVKRDRFTVPYVIASGTNVVQAIKDILGRTFPDLTYDAITTSLSTTAPKVYDVEDDPWDAASELAVSIGCELYFDVEGNVVISPSADIDALPAAVFSYIEGPDCTMTNLAQSYTDEPGYNGVIVTGESPGDEIPPVRGEAWDDEPTSITYRRGPYGEVPMFHQDQVIKTQADADAAAAQLLRGQLGFSSLLSIRAMVNPALEAGEVVDVTRDRSNVDGKFILDAFNIPLGIEDDQSLTLRQKRRVG